MCRGKDIVMKIAIASDHGGYELKEYLKTHLAKRAVEITDLGTDSAESADYPDFGRACGEAVAAGKADKGIVCCGTGIGISIAANKVKGVRCAVCTNAFMAEMCALHNDANIIALGGRVLDPKTAGELVDIWLDTAFAGGRHGRRVDALNSM
jgi:ribose 5-phosphate isomerase B